MLGILPLYTNRSTELDHVKTNFVHKLHRIQHFGALPLSSFKGLISEEDLKSCEKWKKKVPTWYSLTVSTFIAFLYRVSNDSNLFFFMANFFGNFTVFSLLIMYVLGPFSVRFLLPPMKLPTSTSPTRH